MSLRSLKENVLTIDAVHTALHRMLCKVDDTVGMTVLLGYMYLIKKDSPNTSI